MSKSDFCRLSIKEIRDLIPFELTADGHQLAIVCKPEDVIVVSDLHIRMRNKLKAQEKRARMGMPSPERVSADEVRSEEQSGSIHTTVSDS